MQKKHSNNCIYKKIKYKIFIMYTFKKLIFIILNLFVYYY
jgi:hypothetical protein